MANWNPWHGCHKLSSGCLNCYVYRGDARIGKDSDIVTKNSDFALPIQRKKNGEYKLKAQAGLVYTCFTSDFFLEDADQWRQELWPMIKERKDLHFFIITKRIDRFAACIPPDWLDGYENVSICCTVENQEMADYRLPIYLQAPIKHKQIMCEPLLGPLDLSPYLNRKIKKVSVGGESGKQARPCDYNWVLSLRQQCLAVQIDFYFKQTGANFIKDGKLYQIERKLQMRQARRANIDLTFKKGDKANT